MSTGAAIATSVVLLAANAFFVGAEFALVSARRSAIEPRAAAGGWAPQVTLKAMENVSLMMAGAQLGITICSLGLGYLGEPAIAHLLEGPFDDVGIPDGLVHPIAFAVALSLIGFLHVVLGEMVPKNIALSGPTRSALVLAPPLTLIVRGFRPAIALLNWIANASLRAVGVPIRNEVASTFTRDEVAGLVDESRREGLLDQHEGRLLVGALKFEERDARTVLLPSDRLETVSAEVTPHELEQVAARTGYSRFPVCRDGRLEGYLHIKDVLEFEDVHRNRPIARSWIRPLADVKETDRLRAVLATMQRSRAHLARVNAAVDGRVLGVVALEDVLEELVGEIRDEATATAADGP
jgi:CBS domain containing-hemolysin-like protein